MTTCARQWPPLPARSPNETTNTKRCGTANVFSAVEPKAGRHFSLATPDRSGPEFANAVEAIVQSYPAAQTIHLVMDNLNIHCRKTLTDYFGLDYGS
jgi:hypothetical protein